MPQYSIFIMHRYDKHKIVHKRTFCHLHKFRMNFRLKADEILAQQPDNNSPLAAKTNYNYMHGLTEHSYKDVVCG